MFAWNLVLKSNSQVLRLDFENCKENWFPNLLVSIVCASLFFLMVLVIDPVMRQVRLQRTICFPMLHFWASPHKSKKHCRQYAVAYSILDNTAQTSGIVYRIDRSIHMMWRSSRALSRDCSGICAWCTWVLLGFALLVSKLVLEHVFIAPLYPVSCLMSNMLYVTCSSIDICFACEVIPEHMLCDGMSKNIPDHYIAHIT